MVAPARLSGGDGACGPVPLQPEVRVREAAAAAKPRIDSHALLGTAQEVEIVHGSHVYRLRCTSLGKLILTK